MKEKICRNRPFKYTGHATCRKCGESAQWELDQEPMTTSAFANPIITPACGKTHLNPTDAPIGIVWYLPEEGFIWLCPDCWKKIQALRNEVDSEFFGELDEIGKEG